MTVIDETPPGVLGEGAEALIASRYRPVARIGDGGMAQVYRAHDELLGRDVALKVFRRDLTSAEDLHRQQTEVRILARLSHPSLVTLFDCVPGADGHGVLVLEFVDGTDVRHRIEQGPLPPAAVAAIGADIARALTYIHAQGVVHRDVSPANILLPTAQSSGVAAKLTDLGIARLVDDGKVTATGSVMGTASYMSPEQAQGVPLTPASDVYSLGLVLLECLTGRREFPGTAVESAAARLARDPEIPAALPAGWGQLLRAMTQRDPARRPPAAVVAEQLSVLLAESRTPPPALPAPAEVGSTPTDAGPPDATLPLSSAASAVTPERTRRLPTAARTAPASPAPRRRSRSVIVMAIIVLILAVVAVILALAVFRAPRSAPAPTVSYPAVSGQLGDHLAQLEKQVSPQYSVGAG
jgi:serine/threonine protein kinase